MSIGFILSSVLLLPQTSKGLLKLFCVCWMCTDATLCYEIHFSQRLYNVIICECHRNLSLILPLAKLKKTISLLLKNVV